jgi:hypothetical protein
MAQYSNCARTINIKLDKDTLCPIRFKPCADMRSIIPKEYNTAPVNNIILSAMRSKEDGNKRRGTNRPISSNKIVIENRTIIRM